MTSNIKSRKKWLGMTAGLLMVTVMPSYAVDGVIEINHAGALAGGITPGDTVGFPVSISQSGSYRLTGDLAVPVGTSGIEVTADDVTVDLNGFAISGPNDCSNVGFALGHGIDSAGGSNTTVLNGTVVGMGYRGIQGATHVEGVRVLCNGQEGIYTFGRHAKIIGNTVSLNAAGGIIAAGSSFFDPLLVVVSGNLVIDDNIDAGRGVVERNTVSGAKGNCIKATGVVAHNNVNGCLIGIVAGRGSTVIGNTASNSSTGISAGDGSTVKDNTAFDNSVYGIIAGEGSTVKDNAASDNGDTGIWCINGCTLIGNTVRNNGGAGLAVGSLSGYANNVLSGNAGGTVSGGTEIGTNLCNGSTICP